MHSVAWWICLLLQECLEGTDPRMPLLPSSNLPTTSFPIEIFGTIFSAILCLLDQPTPLFELIADQPWAPRFLRITPVRWNCCKGPGQHASAYLLHLPFSGLLFPLQQCGSRELSHIFLESGKRSARVPESLKDAKPAWLPRSLPGYTEAVPTCVG